MCGVIIKFGILINVIEPLLSCLLLNPNTLAFSNLVKNGIVVYENKNDQELKAFKVQQNADEWGAILERCIKIQYMSVNDVPTGCTGAFYCACREVKQ